MKKLLREFATVFAVVFCLSCGGGGSSPTTPSLSPSVPSNPTPTPSTLQVRGNYTFEVRINPACYTGTGDVDVPWPSTVRVVTWPVVMRVDSSSQSVSFGALTSYPVPRDVLQTEAAIRVEPTSSFIDGPVYLQGPGRTAASDGYTFTLESDGGGNGPTRAADGRGELQGNWGEIWLTLSDSNPQCRGGCYVNQWRCFFSSGWSLRIR